ncbi:uncharacterized protein LOC125233404 [Leguminivora glycinivorella]|uniref:uncharacterized protein LOC125233404 n=1 Tax=Leguminivora glycinivorella TaxID=1035111 RepID=UPI0020104CC5|nr:uncharacterized protein LOC125233404 [Leguminivora glycinivorella]
MENNVGTTIEKIKLQEQDKEAKLREKREYEAAVNSLNRSIREAVFQIEKHQEEIKELTKGNDVLKAQLEVERIKRNAVAAQVEACSKEIEVLRAQSDKGISDVWSLRSSLCKAVQNVSDECDVWGLLVKPINSDPIHRVVKKPNSENNEEAEFEERLKLAKERHERAVAERERLLAEPEKGEEFIRIKNALRYSLEMTANLRKE